MIKKEDNLTKINAPNLKFKIWYHFLAIILSILIALPVFVFSRDQVDIDIDFLWKKAILFIAIFIFFYLIIRVFLSRIQFVLLVYLITFIVINIQGKYNVVNVITEYEVMFQSFNSASVSNKNGFNLISFPNQVKIEASVDYNNPKIRNFALYAINKNFKSTKNYIQNRRLIQYFAVFKEVNSRWFYVNDPKVSDYFAKASESLTYFSGDCDDHAILMCAAIKSIGGTTRLVHTGNHLYPELKIGKTKDLEKAIYIINNQLFKTNKKRIFYYHIDENSNIWLNLDYTEKYPGGRFLVNTVLSILEL